MHAVKKRPDNPLQKPLHDILSKIYRHDRLHIAVGLACGVMQCCGNWLKAWWNSSDVFLSVGNDDHSVFLDSAYLSWPLLIPGTSEAYLASNHPRVINNLLLPLGLALVELSLGKPLSTLLVPEDEDQNMVVTRFNTASRLVKVVYNESGQSYADAVESCLSWSGPNSCFERWFEERVFDKSHLAYTE